MKLQRSFRETSGAVLPRRSRVHPVAVVIRQKARTVADVCRCMQRATRRSAGCEASCSDRGMRGYGDQVACRITELVLDARDPELLARFWCEVLGYVELERVEGDIEIGPPGVGFGGPQPTIVLSQTDEPKAGKLPLHIDVNATDREQDDELERLLAAGARRVDIGQTGAESWHVLADPEGNEFCLLRRRVPEV